MKRILLVALALTLFALPASAAVPRTFNIQGILTDDTGITLPDATYQVDFLLWNTNFGGALVWSESIPITQTNGVFEAALGHAVSLDPDIFTTPLWLSMMIDGGAATMPRIEMTSVASAMIAAAIEPGAAVRSLNGLADNVVLVAGTNVSITQVDTTLVISATAGAGGDDGDWVITGDDLHHIPGRVHVGVASIWSKDVGDPTRAQTHAPDPVFGKFTVEGANEGIKSILFDNDNVSDARTAIYARRQRGSIRNDGYGYGVNEANTAITGFNDWGDSYTFGVAGYSWWDYPRTGAVFGARHSGTTWAALAYNDSSDVGWGVYTNDNIFAGSYIQAPALKLTGGAAAGYVLTSDTNGNATWQAPGAAAADTNWTVSGDNLSRTSTGAVAIGTDQPHTLGGWDINTTMQVSATLASALCLDITLPSLSRASLTHSFDGLYFGWTDDYAVNSTQAYRMAPGTFETFNPSGDTAIKLLSGDSNSTGSQLSLYGTTSTTIPAIILDSQTGASASQVGGYMKLQNTAGVTEVTVTASHNGSGIGRVITPVLEITGGSDLSEQFDLGDVSALTKPGMVVSIDPESPGQLTLSGKAYDRRVAGVISGAGGVNTGMVMGQKGSVADGEFPVALVGRVYVWADASSGPIEPGDLLTTAELPGHAMKVTDHTLATGAILGKAMTGLTEGQGLILTLVSLQ